MVLDEGRMLAHVDAALRELSRDEARLNALKVSELPKIVRAAVPSDVEMTLSKKQLVARFRTICEEGQSSSSSSSSSSSGSENSDMSEDESDGNPARQSRRPAKRATPKKRKRRQGPQRAALDPDTPIERLAQDMGTRGAIALAAASLQLNLSKMPIQDVTNATLDEALGILARIRASLVESAQDEPAALDSNRKGFLELMRVRFHELIPCANESLKIDSLASFSRRFEATWRLDHLRDLDAIVARADDSLEGVRRQVFDPLQVCETALDTDNDSMGERWKSAAESVPLGDAFCVRNPPRAAGHLSWAKAGPSHVAFVVRPACSMMSLLRRGLLPPRPSAASCLGIESAGPAAVSVFETAQLALEHHRKTSVFTPASGLYMVCLDLALGPVDRCVQVETMPRALPSGANAMYMEVATADGDADAKRWFVYEPAQARLHSFAKIQ